MKEGIKAIAKHLFIQAIILIIFILLYNGLNYLNN